MKGSIRARVVAPPNPGRRPTTKPISIPTSIKPKAGKLRTCNSPSMKASNSI